MWPRKFKAGDWVVRDNAIKDHFEKRKAYQVQAIQAEGRLIFRGIGGSWCPFAFTLENASPISKAQEKLNIIKQQIETLQKSLTDLEDEFNAR